MPVTFMKQISEGEEKKRLRRLKLSLFTGDILRTFHIAVDF
jgi:hypothetical protein